MARNAGQKKEGMFSRMISVVGGGEEDNEQGERNESVEGAESATTLLKSEHDEVRRLFKDFENASQGARAARKRIADEVGQKLDVHAQIEEKIFYPACRGLQDEDARKMVGESLEEHLIVKRLIAELARLDASDETFESKFTVLKESVEHHADEEEKDLFPEAEKELGDERLEELGAQMAQLKRRLLSGAQSGRSGASKPSSGRGSRPSSRSGSRGQSRGRTTSSARPGGSQASRSRSAGSSSRSGGSRSRSSSSGRSSSRTPSSKRK